MLMERGQAAAQLGRRSQDLLVGEPVVLAQDQLQQEEEEEEEGNITGTSNNSVLVRKGVCCLT